MFFKRAIGVRRPRLFACVTGLIILAAACMPLLALGQDTGEDGCEEGYERLPGSKECTPVERTGPVLDPGLLETPGSGFPLPILVLPTQPPDPVTPRSDETPAAPTPAPRAYGSLTIHGLTCPRWHMPDYTNGLIPPCGSLPGLVITLVSDGVPIADGVTQDSEDSSVPAEVAFYEIPAGKLTIEQKPASGHESLEVFCGKGDSATAVPLATKSAVIVELEGGRHLTCTFVNVSAK